MIIALIAGSITVAIVYLILRAVGIAAAAVDRST
jgi:hypothetical protein